MNTNKYLALASLVAVIVLTVLFNIGETTDTITQYVPSAHSQTAAVSDFNSSLIAHYTFDGNANDSAGSNNGTANGGPTYVAGKLGQAMSFDGIDDYVTANASSFPTANASRTVTGWIKSSNRSQSAVVLSYGNSSYTFYTSFGGGGGRISTAEGSLFSVAGSTNLADDVWHHFAIVHDSTGPVQRVYIDGVENITGANTYSTNNDPTAYIGNRASLNRPFSGSLDDLRVYNRALTASEVSELYNYTGGSSGGGGEEPPPPATCTSFTYSAWGTCSGGSQTRTITSSSPSGCTGGSPEALTQSCTVNPSDTTPPSVPTGLTATAISSSQINLSWNASSDNITVAGYNIYRGGTFLTNTTNTSYQNTGLTANTTYSYTVSAYDAVPNTSSQTSPVTATTQAVTSPPTSSNGCGDTSTRCVPSEYATVQACANAAVAGDTCKVSSGIYSEIITVSRDGSSGNPITFLGESGATLCGFNFTNRSHIRVIGFTIDGNAGSCTMRSGLVLLSGVNNYLEFWNNHFTDSLYNGIRVGINDHYHNSIIVGNIFSNMGVGNGSGVAVATRGNNNFISYNEVYNMHPDGFVMFGSNNRWMNNYTHNFSEASGGHADIFQTGTSLTGWNFNLIEATFQEGIGDTGDEHSAQISNGQGATYGQNGIGAMTENIFRNNIWHNVSSGTVGVNQTFDGPITYIRYYNNTTADAQVNYPTNRYHTGMTHQGSNHWYGFNNIEYKAWGSSASSNIGVYCLSRDTSCNTSAGAGFNYGMNFNLAYDPKGNVSFIAPWTTQTNALTNVNPQFVNFSADDFRIGSNSPARNSGGHLTTISQSGSNVSTISVADAGYFRGDTPTLNQYGGNLVVGDLITIGTGANADTRRIQSISGNSITLTSPVTVVQGEPVYFGDSTTPHIGALPYKASYAISPSLYYSNGVLTASVSDPSIVRHVEFYVDGIPVGVDNEAPYTFNTSQYTAGSTHTVRAVARPLFASKTLGYQTQSSITIGSDGTPPPPSICTSFTYSSWSTCSAGTQTRTVISSSPLGCSGGTPVLTQSCTTGAIPGDLDLDGVVNSVDFSLLISRWNQTYPAYDLNGDGVVNSLDFSVMAQNWTM